MEFRKIIVTSAFFCCLFSAGGILAREYTVAIDSNGIIKEDPDGIYRDMVQENIRFHKGDRIIVEIVNDPSHQYEYLYEVVKSRIDYEVIPIFTGKTEERSLVPTKKEGRVRITVALDRSGTRYRIAITRYNDKDFADRKRGVNISAYNFRTAMVYYFGAQVGFFIPLMRTNAYSIRPLPDQPPFGGASGLIYRKSFMEYNAVFIGSVYPFGFEPGVLFPSNYAYRWKDYFGAVFRSLHKLIHLDLAFELSKNIFSRLYFGGGLSFGLFSVSFLARYEKAEDVGLHLGNNQIVPAVFAAASPLRERHRWSYGISVSLPLDFAFSWIGNALR
jgi:hypothetical protein